MIDTTQSNKKLAKNTLFMYFRMLLTMIVGLYTSRVVLQTLGIEDFGIYNVVGGVVVLFTFINSAMSTVTQRHLAYELGKKDGDMSKIFSMCFNIHVGIAIIITLLAETGGLWFLNNKMNFPENKMLVVNIVYQITILTTIANIIRVPYNALILAEEHMNFYAYTGIVEALLKLLIVYLLVFLALNKLILYAVLLFLVISIINIIYIYYCKSRFHDIKLIKVHDRNIYKSLLSFSGWSMFGSLANVGYQQGINVLINIFYGVTFNTVVGIANQVNTNISNFVVNFQQALNPQLIKTQSSGDKERQFSLICKASKFSFLIMFFIALPLMINLNYVLELWLGIFPSHTIEICNIIVIAALIESLSGPLFVTIYAVGKIKKYQIAISTLLLLNVPISYLIGKFGGSAEGMFYVRMLIYVLCFVTRIIFLKELIDLDWKKYLINAVVPIIIVLCVIFIPIVCLYKFLIVDNFICFVLISSIIVIYESIVILFLGLTNSERKGIIRIFKNKISKQYD